MVIKRTEGKPATTLEANKLYFRTPGQGGEIKLSGNTVLTPTAGFEDWEYFVEIYYIKDEDSDGDGVDLPGLFRKRLIVSSGVVTLQDDGVLVPGIRRFGVLYGVDTSGDGIADQYDIASTYSGDLSQVVSARVSVLAGSSDEDLNNNNNKLYSLYPSVVSTASISGMTGSHYYGRVFTTTAQIRNNAYRIQIYSLRD